MAKEIRSLVLEAIYKAQSGHVGGSFSVVEILTYLYFGGGLKHHPKKPYDPDRDRFILSAGHVVPTLYAALSLSGYFPVDELLTLRQLGSRLEGHPQKENLPGIEATTGSLGQGVGVACGLALGLSLKKPKDPPKVVALISDGELEEGSVWEAFLFANNYKLRNLLFILNKNGTQSSGKTEEITKMEPLTQKFDAFGLSVAYADGHNFSSLDRAFSTVKLPGVVIAKTETGHGASVFAGDFHWHSRVIDPDSYRKAKKELSKP